MTACGVCARAVTGGHNRLAPCGAKVADGKTCDLGKYLLASRPALLLLLGVVLVVPGLAGAVVFPLSFLRDGSGADPKHTANALGVKIVEPVENISIVGLIDVRGTLDKQLSRRR
jgi:hypothetical protein